MYNWRAIVESSAVFVDHILEIDMEASAVHRFKAGTSGTVFHKPIGWPPWIIEPIHESLFTYAKACTDHRSNAASGISPDDCAYNGIIEAANSRQANTAAVM